MRPEKVAHEAPRDDSRSDAALVADALVGHAQAYEHLVRRYERPVRAMCFAVVKDWHVAQDAAQDSFLSAFSKLNGLRKRAAFGGWLLAIARRRSIQIAKEMKRQPVLNLNGELLRGNPERNDAEGLFELVARLPEHEQVLVMLRYVEGRDVASIARICGRPLGTVTKQLSRARRRLQTVLEKEQRQ